MKGDDIAERLLEFAVAVLRITTKGISLLVERHSACEVAGQGSQRTPPRSSRAGRDPGCFRKDRPHSFQGVS